MNVCVCVFFFVNEGKKRNAPPIKYNIIAAIAGKLFNATLLTLVFYLSFAKDKAKKLRNNKILKSRQQT